MQVEKGFAVKLVAAEPLVTTPVAMAFDDSLHLWVAEMNRFHMVKDGEDMPYGKVVILKDTDGDGRMDESHVFMDSLHAPRAIHPVKGGILLAIPPNLWYVENDHGKPGRKVLIDSAYTATQNVEGQTNGLYRSIDNWIYDAGFGSQKRYRKINGHWRIKKTHLRGQYGISQDNYGHLFYNNNSRNLLGDYFLPSLGSGNKYQKHTAGFDKQIVKDTRVYPAIPTPGVNRGYREGVLDDSLRLKHFTAACGPVIYRGGLFGPEYAGNAFVNEPAAHLIKRDILQQKGTKITGKEAYKGKEFLASTDRRFRPVQLKNGPDGALYVADMYRGVIEDSLSMTDYLTKYAIKHEMAEPLPTGRIYKIVPKGKQTHMVAIPDDPDTLVHLLESRNGWVRDRAQEKLVTEGYSEAVPGLRKLLEQKEAHPLAAIHALWTIEGLNALKPSDLIPFLKASNSHFQREALTVLTSTVDRSNYQTYLPVIKQLTAHADSVTAPYVAYAVNSFYAYAPDTVNKLLGHLLSNYSDNVYVSDAVINGLHGHRGRKYLAKFPDTTTRFHQRLAKIVKKKRGKGKGESGNRLAALKKRYPKGAATFNAICQTCHAADGNGITYQGPPLNKSEWVTGDMNKTIAILLYGLTGPVKVNGRTYKKPGYTSDMPALGRNFSNQKVAQVLSYIRKRWGNRAGEVQPGDVKKIRDKFKDRQKAFTAKELKQIFGEEN